MSKYGLQGGIVFSVSNDTEAVIAFSFDTKRIFLFSYDRGSKLTCDSVFSSRGDFFGRFITVGSDRII